MRTAVLIFAASMLCIASRATAQSKPQDQEDRIQRLEAKAVDLYVKPNEPALQLRLQKLMELYRIPGFSIAAIDDYKIAWAKPTV
jgi:hypothetical protein